MADGGQRDGAVEQLLGGLIEICIVTADHQRTMEGLVRLGIGPWRIYTFDSRTVTKRTFQGHLA